MSLSIEQTLFLTEYRKTRNATKAAFACGAPGKNASAEGRKMMEDPEIKLALIQDAEKMRKQCDVDEEFIINALKDNLERAMAAEEILTSKGSSTGKFRYNGQVANRTLELLGKHIGMFKDIEPQTNTNTGPTILIVNPDGRKILQVESQGASATIRKEAESVVEKAFDNE
jgi:phage terminase small subunit